MSSVKGSVSVIVSSWGNDNMSACMVASNKIHQGLQFGLFKVQWYRSSYGTDLDNSEIANLHTMANMRRAECLGQGFGPQVKL